MAPWIAALELFLTQQLLKSPAFHRAVGKVHKNVHRLRHGVPPEEMGGTKIDSPGMQGFMSHFVDELKGQAGRSSATPPPSSIAAHSRPQASRRAQSSTTHTTRDSATSAGSSRPSEASASPTSAQGQGFVSHFLEELKGQFRGGDKTR
ncbi:hypothetical protein MBLNU459_g0009t1 [Dothideomycetes sp. NU459]